MPHIQLETGVPGIRSLVLFRPETGEHLYELAEILLRGPSPLSSGERELIAAYVSGLNNCFFCMSSHAAAARCHFGSNAAMVDAVLKDMNKSEIGEKMKALLHIAGKVRLQGKNVLPGDITAAREAGAGDRDIHDTVLIAAAFSMFNRYVDGLASFTPTDPVTYEEMGKRMAERGYAFLKTKNN